MNLILRHFSFLFISALTLIPFQIIAGNNFGFIENQGQILNQFRQPNSEVIYLYNQGNFQVQLKRNGFSYQLNKLNGKPNTNLNPKSINKDNNPEFSSHRIDFIFEMASKDFLILPSLPNSSHLNFYNEFTSDKAVLVKHFQKILYQNVYPGIDIEFIINKEFKYNIIVHDGANLQAFKLKLLGSPFDISSDGSNFTIKTALGQIKEEIPYSYIFSNDQKQVPVKAKFKLLTNNLIGIECGERTHKEKLIIDPSPWSTYFGGTYYENANSIVTDSNGNSYSTGYTYSVSNIATNGAFQSTHGGNNDGFISMFNENGQLIWATYYGGNNNDYCYEIAITKQNNIIIAGLTGSSIGISSQNAFQDTLWGITDAFVVKFNNLGVRTWATYFGGNLFDYGIGITSDQNDNIVLSGYSNSVLGITSSSSYQSEIGGGNDGFLAKFASNGDLLWSTFYGGYGSEYANGVSCDLNGNIYLTGFTSSPNNIATTNVFQENLAGSGTSEDAFLVKFSPTGQRIWGTYFGGQGNEDGRSVLIDKFGQVYLTGSTHSSQNIATQNAFQNFYMGEGDGFLAKFDSLGQRIWSTYLGNLGNDYLNDIAFDNSGKVIVCGFSNSETGIATINTHQSFNRGGYDAILAKFDTSGARIWSTFFGGMVGDFAYSVAVGKLDYIYFVGLTSSMDHIVTSNPWQSTFGGTNDAFIVLMTPNGSLIPIGNNSINGNQTLCKGIQPNLILGTTPTGGSGIYSYQWLISTTGPNSNFVLAQNSSNQPYYLSHSNWNNPIWIKRLVISGGEVDSSNSVYLNFSSITNKEFSINSSTQCANENQFKLSYIPLPIDSIEKIVWRFGDGSIDSNNLQVVSKKFGLPGNYLIKMMVTSKKGCLDSFSINTLVNPSPNAIAFTNSPTEFCEGKEAIIETNNFSGVFIRWLHNQLPTGDSLSKYYCKNTGLFQSVHLNNYGCYDTSNAISIKVNPNPIAKINFSDSLKVLCIRDTVILNSEQPNQAFYQWRYNQTNIFGSNQSTFKAIKTGDYNLIIRNNFGCFDTSISTSLIFNPLPSINPITGPANVKADLSVKSYSCNISANHQYNWLVNGANIISIDSNLLKLTFGVEGTAQVKMIETNTFGCKGDTNRINILVEKKVGLLELKNSPIGYQISPNPSNGNFKITFLEKLADKILILDVAGKPVLEILSPLMSQSIDVSNLCSGEYFIIPSSLDYKFQPQKILIF